MIDNDFSGRSVVIERWHTTYLVPRDHPAPDDLKARLDELVSGEMAGACESWLSPLLDPADPSVWLIRELDLDLALDASRGSESHAAQTWGERLAGKINHVITRGQEGDLVLRFPSRAAYLAHLAGDIAGGRAWDRWYYQEFDSLRSLPASAAIREALCESGLASDVLQYLAAQQKLEGVLSALSDHDAEQIYRSLLSPASETASPADERRCAGRLLELWDRVALSTSSAAQIRSHDQLRLYAFAKTTSPGIDSDRALVAAIDGLLELQRIFSGLPSPEPVQEYLRAATAGERDRAIRALSNWGPQISEGGLQFLIRASDGDANWAARAAAILAPKADNYEDAAGARGSQESFLSTFAGIFLLGPSFAELQIETAVAAAAKTCSEPERAMPLIRHFLAIKCIGRQRALEAIEDHALKAFAGMGLDQACSHQEISAAVKAADAERALQILVGALAQGTRISPDCLAADLVALPGAGFQAILLRDALHDEWVHASLLGSAGEAAALERSLRFVLDATGETPQELLLGPGLARLGNSRLLQQHAGKPVELSDTGAAVENAAAGLGMKPGRLARAVRSADQDLEYFSLAGLVPGFEIPPACDLAWSLVARAIWKNFARKLIGFEASSPDYLFRNFLEGLSSIRSRPDRLEVQLPQSPLAMVLRLSGAYPPPYVLPWCEEKEICLQAPAE